MSHAKTTTEDGDEKSKAVAPSGIDPRLIDGEALNLRSGQRKRLDVFVTWLSRIDHMAARVISGRENRVVSPAELEDLEAAVTRKFKPLPEAVEHLRILGSIIELGRQLKCFDLPPPRIPNLAKRPKNPLHEDAATGIARVRNWNDVFDRGLDGRYPALGDDPEAGQQAKVFTGRVLASAIMHSGLHHPTAIVAFARALKEKGQTLHICSNRVFVQLSLPWQGQPDMEKRRWIPRADTAMLLVRLPQRSASIALEALTPELADKKAKVLVWGCIQAYFRQAGHPQADLPTSLSAMIRAVRDDGFTFLPPVLLAYASRQIVSHSLRPQAIRRLAGGVASCAVDEAPISVPVDEKDGSRSARTDRGTDFETPWIRELRTALKATSRAAAVNGVSAFLLQWKDRDVRARVFAEFADFLLGDQTFSGNSRSINSIRTSVISCARRLGCMAAGEDLTSFSTETLETIYADAVDIASDQGRKHRMKRAVALVLRDFHRFLVRRYAKEPVNEREVFGIAQGLLPVDANIVSVDEYESILGHLKLRSPTGTHPELIRVACLIVMIAFRCGLRRMEVLMLRLCDMKLRGRAAILVRPTDERRLKTKSSTRTMPIEALLTDDERSILKEWTDTRRHRAGNNKEALLFQIPELINGSIPQERIFPLIHSAMRAATGDDTLRFHHLRHSFATWTFLRLNLSDLEVIPELFPAHPKTSEWLGESKNFRASLYRNQCPTRRHAYATAALLGHSGPDISLEHYVHVCDLLLWVRLQQAAGPQLKKRVILAAGESKSAIYRRLKQGAADDIPALILEEEREKTRLNVPGKAGRPPKLTQTVELNELTVAELKSSAPYRACHLLFVTGTQGLPPEDLAEQFGFRTDDCERIVRRAGLIADLQTLGKGTHQHRMMEWTPDLRDPEKTHRLHCPNLPRTADEKRVVRKFLPRMTQLIRQRPEIVMPALTYFVLNSWSTRNELIFHDPDQPQDAILYLQFLTALGIGSSNIRLVSFDEAERSRYRAAWKSSLGLNWRRPIDKNAPSSRESEAVRKWLGIRPIFDEKENTGFEGRGAYGFRFLMTMTAILAPFEIAGVTT